MNKETIQNKIEQTPALLLYFSGIGCSVCHDLKPKLHEALQKSYSQIEWLEISVDEYREIAAHFEVFALPTVILFLDGKEFIKKARSFGVDELLGEIKRPYQLFFEE